MIKKEEVIRIGQFNKPHGVKGELSFTYTNSSFDGSECTFFICEIDGILVPFSIEGYRIKSDVTALVKLKGINSESDAQKLINLDIYFPNAYCEKISCTDATTWDYFVGYALEDITQGRIGEIIDIEESTINTLFVVENGQAEYLIPATEDWIVGIDSESKILQVELPEGLIGI